MNKAAAMTLSLLVVVACDRDRDKTDGPRFDPPRLEPTTTATEVTEASILTDRDRAFLIDATSGGMFEVDSSKVALDRGDLGTMKAFAEMMISDHKKANDALEDLCDKKEWAFDAKLQDEAKVELDELEKAPEADVRKMYHRMQLEGHEKAVKLFEKCAQTCDDPDLRKFAKDTLPTLRFHLDEIRKVALTAM